MKQGNWFGNIIMWLIGGIVLYLWVFIGVILGIFGAWQVGADGILQTITDLKGDMIEIKDDYLGDAKLPSM